MSATEIGSRTSAIARIQWGEISAISMVALMPALIVAFILQKHLVRGLSFGVGRV